MNKLYFGDNLDVLREHVRADSVDLIYLDPPFNSKRGYNVLWKESEAQAKAFVDAWQWDDAAKLAYEQLTDPKAESKGVSQKLITLIESLHSVLVNDDQELLAYLVMMSQRLVALRRVLKASGSLYLHCDPTASHYLKLVMDAVFSSENFLSEVIWRRTGTHSSAKRWGPVHDVILCYAKSTGKHTWNRPYVPMSSEHVKRHYQTDAQGRVFTHGELTAPGTRNGRSGVPWRGFDVAAMGRHWCTTVEKLDELAVQGLIYFPPGKGWPRLVRYGEPKGKAIGDVWEDIPPLNMMAKERTKFPTQKPLKLLERIIQASSNPGDVVLDPFCGCGTAVHAAEKLGRRWIGIDVAHVAIRVIRTRLAKEFPKMSYKVNGEPRDLASAQALFDVDPHQFQAWAVSLIGGWPADAVVSIAREPKKGGDKGIDGIIRYKEDSGSHKSDRVIISVKGGRNLNPGMVRDLHGTIQREKATIGVFLTLHEPSSQMRSEAKAAEKYRADGTGRAYDRIQIISIADALKGKRPDFPGQDVTESEAVAAAMQPDLFEYAAQRKHPQGKGRRVSKEAKKAS